MSAAVACIAVVVFALSGAAQVTPQLQAPSATGGKSPANPPSKTRQPARGKQRRNQAADAANTTVEVIGADNANPSANIDHPLLPIASIGNSLGIRSGTPIQVKLKQTVSSGHAHNGDTLDATLAQPLASLPAGTPVKLTVVQASPAGALLSFGELSLQVVSIGTHSVLSDTISAQGEEGKKEQADAAPTRGTEAVFQAGQVISLPAA